MVIIITPFGREEKDTTDFCKLCGNLSRTITQSIVTEHCNPSYNYPRFYARDYTSVIKMLCSHFSLPQKITDEAISIFHKYTSSSRSGAYLSIAAVYVALKTSDCKPISVKTFLNNLPSAHCKGWKRKTILREYRNLIVQLDKKPLICYNRPTMFVLDLAEKLKFSKKTRLLAIKLAKAVEKKRLHLGRSPTITAGTICYMIRIKDDKSYSNELRSRRDITKLVGTTSVSLLKAYQILVDGLSYIGMGEL